jgi:hypothetical protein
MLDLNALDLGEIAHALSDQAAYEHCWLIHSQTGEIVYWSADTGIDGHSKTDLDDLDTELICIRPLPSWVWYQDMEDFAGGTGKRDHDAQLEALRPPPSPLSHQMQHCCFISTTTRN